MMTAEERKEYMRQHYAANREKLLARQKQYRAENREKILERKRRYYEANPDKRRKRNQPRGNRRPGHLAQYGMTLHDYEYMLAAQGYACAICHAGPEEEKHKTLCVDHCHTTGKVRGLLCTRCNRALGLFRDCQKVLKAAVRYLDD